MNDLHARERHIAEVLVRQGLTQLAAAAGLNGLASHSDQADAVAPRNLRLALEELGPTFVKLGQILSTRGDLLSPRYGAELAELQDAAPAVSATAVEHIIEQELGPKAFAWLDLDPLASASIGQAHAARLHDGTEVVVKVRRPGAREQIERSPDSSVAGSPGPSARCERGHSAVPVHDPDQRPPRTHRPRGVPVDGV